MRKELAAFAGGGFFELACHILDATMHISGQAEGKSMDSTCAPVKKNGDDFRRQSTGGS